MKRFYGLLLTMAALSACHHANDKGGDMASNPESVDSLENETAEMAADLEAEQQEESQALAKHVDLLFDDFIYDYSGNRYLQKERTKFPLTYEKDESVMKISQKEWHYDNIFGNADSYIVIFDNQQQSQLMSAENVASVNIDRIYLKNGQIHRFCFNKIKGLWNLTAIDEHEWGVKENAEFLKFLGRFINDNAFQQQHLAQSIQFVSSDVDDYDNMVSGTLDAEQWDAFKPEMATDTMISIDYGQHYSGGHSKLVIRKGISNGMMEFFTFKKQDGVWKLVSYEN